MLQPLKGIVIPMFVFLTSALCYRISLNFSVAKVEQLFYVWLSLGKKNKQKQKKLCIWHCTSIIEIYAAFFKLFYYAFELPVWLYIFMYVHPIFVNVISSERIQGISSNLTHWSNLTNLNWLVFGAQAP